jgi:hypothetical protein
MSRRQFWVTRRMLAQHAPHPLEPALALRTAALAVVTTRVL